MKNLLKTISLLSILVTFISCEKEKVKPIINNDNESNLTISEPIDVLNKNQRKVDIILFVRDTNNIGQTSINVLTNSSDETLVDLAFTDTLFNEQPAFYTKSTCYFSDEFIKHNNIVVFEANTENNVSMLIKVELDGEMGFYENDVPSISDVEDYNSVKTYLWFVNDNFNANPPQYHLDNW